MIITTFNQTLYNATGYNLIESCIKTGNVGDVVVYDEDVVYDEAHKFIPSWNILNDLYIKRFLERNKDIIPIKYGGEYPECSKHCQPERGIWKGHIRGCLNGGFNSRMFPWFKKVVAIHHFSAGSIKPFIFLDSDCIIKQYISYDIIENILNGSRIGYHWSNYRKRVSMPVETGVILFGRDSHSIINDWLDIFMSGKFRQYEHWSDAHMFTEIIKGRNDCVDLVGSVREDLHGHVVALGPLKDYIDHYKGSHGKVHKVV